jgi:hypothetical protein
MPKILRSNRVKSKQTRQETGPHRKNGAALQPLAITPFPATTNPLM